MRNSSAYVLYVDHAGHPAPLTETFHATAARRLSSTTNTRYPPSSLTQVDAAYCPHCLSFHDAATASRIQYCSKYCARCPVCVSSMLRVVADGKDGQEQRLVYRCGQCDFKSHFSAPLTGDGKLEIAKAAEELGREWTRIRQEQANSVNHYFASLLKGWEPERQRRHERGTTEPLIQLADSNDGEGPSNIDLLEQRREDMRQKLHRPEESDAMGTQHGGLFVAGGDIDSSSGPGPTASPLNGLSSTARHWQNHCMPLRSDHLLPLPTPLRMRRSRRCRAELAEGRAGILLKPKLNPLEGDTSLRTGHGQWWRKDSSAIHVIPRVTIERQESIGSEKLAFLLKVANPTLGLVRLRLAPSDYEGERTWDEDTQFTNVLPRVLVDTVCQEEWNITIQKEKLAGTTDIVELLSAEDSIIEMGARSRKLPETVVNWNPSAVQDLKLVAHVASDAWFELTVPSLSLGFTDHPAAAMSLEVELGNGSWESSLIQPLKGNEQKRDDWIRFNLLLTW